MSKLTYRSSVRGAAELKIRGVECEAVVIERHNAIRLATGKILVSREAVEEAIREAAQTKAPPVDPSERMRQ